MFLYDTLHTILCAGSTPPTSAQIVGATEMLCLVIEGFLGEICGDSICFHIFIGIWQFSKKHRDGVMTN
jgi:hypothetical protein